MGWKSEEFVILPDTNMWLALALSKHDFHSGARDWFAAQTARKSVMFCRSTQQSLLRLLTTDMVMRLYELPPLSNVAAWQMLEGFMADPRVGWSPEPQSIESQWKKLATRRTSSPKLWMDAYLAAFAIAGGYQLITTDAAFTQFQNLNSLVLAKSVAS